jgi:hypothetical protein
MAQPSRASSPIPFLLPRTFSGESIKSPRNSRTLSGPAFGIGSRDVGILPRTTSCESSRSVGDSRTRVYLGVPGVFGKDQDQVLDVSHGLLSEPAQILK